MRKRRALTLVEILGVICLCVAAVAVGYYGFYQDWKFLRDWGGTQQAKKLSEGKELEPMGISSDQVMVGLEKVFKLEETLQEVLKDKTLSLVRMRPPRYFAGDEETMASLEIRGEKENIVVARLTVWMPRLGLTLHQYDTQQTISYNLMETFISNTVPETLPRRWLKELVAGYTKGGDIAVEKVSSGRKLLIRKDSRMRDMISVIVVKDVPVAPLKNK